MRMQQNYRNLSSPNLLLQRKLSRCTALVVPRTRLCYLAFLTCMRAAFLRLLILCFFILSLRAK
jgi:hypothetical protein